MKIFDKKDWNIRSNKKRKNHPAIVVGEEDNSYLNLGLTHSKKRGHHNNIPLSKNPNSNDNSVAYVRNTLQIDDKKYLKKVLSHYQLSEDDFEKIYKIIKKRYPLGGSH